MKKMINNEQIGSWIQNIEVIFYCNMYFVYFFLSKLQWTYKVPKFKEIVE